MNTMGSILDPRLPEVHNTFNLQRHLVSQLWYPDRRRRAPLCQTAIGFQHQRAWKVAALGFRSEADLQSTGGRELLQLVNQPYLSSHYVYRPPQP
jgi:hypothetical protein